jgi:lipopolysaccharide/colanic/teichoic acid biosynthesis glycosyltransferase
VIDIAFAALSLLVLLIPFLVIAVLIKLHDGGPVLYRAPRIGRNGKPFRLYKFRSMSVDADKVNKFVTTSDDDRVTPIGKWLRAKKVDELPQLINVLKGEMSLVGPRPESPKYVDLYTPTQRNVLQVRPGITSAASLAYRHEESMLAGGDWEEVYLTRILPDKLQLDLDYLERRTIGSDIRLILKTAKAIFD